MRRQINTSAVWIIISFLLLISHTGCGSNNSQIEEKGTTQDTIVTPKKGKYGLPLANYAKEKQFIKSGQNLSDLLFQKGIPAETIHIINENTKGIFDVRQMRVGRPYTFFMSKDSARILKYMVYEHTPIEYVVVDFENGLRVTKGARPTTWKQDQIKGRVESSLWVSLQQQQKSPMIAMIMSDIFGWTIDFFDLKKDDEYRIVYEQQFVDSIPLPQFRVRAASYQQEDSLYYAIPFTQDNEELYYNDKGQSLEGAFLKAPLDFYRITSRFTNRRFHPVLKRYRAHHGVDYAAPIGTPVY